MITMDELKKALAGVEGVSVRREYVDRPARVFGDTYALRSQFKAWGGRWNHRIKAWEIPVENDGDGDLDYMSGY